jgi:hypothetical protein
LRLFFLFLACRAYQIALLNLGSGDDGVLPTADGDSTSRRTG